MTYLFSQFIGQPKNMAVCWHLCSGGHTMSGRAMFWDRNTSILPPNSLVL